MFNAKFRLFQENNELKVRAFIEKIFDITEFVQEILRMLT